MTGWRVAEISNRYLSENVTKDKFKFSTDPSERTSTHLKVTGMPERDCPSPSGLDTFLAIWSTLGHLGWKCLFTLCPIRLSTAFIVHFHD